MQPGVDVLCVSAVFSVLRWCNSVLVQWSSLSRSCDSSDILVRPPCRWWQVVHPILLREVWQKCPLVLKDEPIRICLLKVEIRVTSQNSIFWPQLNNLHDQCEADLHKCPLGWWYLYPKGQPHFDILIFCKNVSTPAFFFFSFFFF